MRIGIPREIHEGEKRVATTPEAAEQLRKLGYEVALETRAGRESKYSDDAYREAGVIIVPSARELWDSSAIILKVRAPETHPELCVDETELLKPGKILISFIQPALNADLLKKLAATGATVLAMDSVPRISRAQKLDALSSMANIAGYRAVVEAAQHFPRFFTGQITAAGKLPPAKVLVIGAGVAGLSAIGAARSMGAIVRAFDTRPEVKEQVESLDAEFLMLEFAEDGSGEGGYAKTMSAEFIRKEMELFAKQAMEVDIVITTALIPGKPAPELWTPAMVETMREGSVIVDLAAEMGGNCKLTEKDKVVVKHGVTLVGYTDLPSRLAAQASQLYATNLRHLLTDLTPDKDGKPVIDMEDEVVRGCTVIKEGIVTWPPPTPRLYAVPQQKAATASAVTPAQDASRSALPPLIAALIAAVLLAALGAVAPPDFMAHLTVFVLACFVGYMVIWNVSPSLHTPLMSVTNAISSIVVIGALLQISAPEPLRYWVAAFAVLITSVNIFGGFAVTRRMLAMFRK
jgi:H+-translocating NAD(P) transhydrogenase subunit alpha